MAGEGSIRRVMQVAGYERPTEPYVCRGCGDSFEVGYRECPECESQAIERPPS